MTINLNSYAAGTLNMNKEKYYEIVNSKASGHGSEPTDEILDSNLISSKSCKFKRESMTVEIMQEIREEEEPLERWKQKNKTNTIPRNQIFIFPITNPNLDGIEATAEMIEDVELPLRDKS